METNQEGATEVEAKATGKAMGSSDKDEAGKGRRIRVSQKYIDMLLKEKATGTGAYKVSKSMEQVEKYYKGPHDFRSLVARSDACMEKVRAEDAKILEQYELFGCAYTDAKEDVSRIDEEKIRRYLPRWPAAA